VHQLHLPAHRHHQQLLASAAWTVGVPGGRVDRFEVGSYVEDHCLHVARSCGQFGCPVVAAGLVVERAEDETAVDGLAATGPVL
jgi:hypothetical protein